MERAGSLAQSAFGDSHLYLEKYLHAPSHVEVQVLADSHGKAIHLFERDCSAQRRNQKVIEETPCIKIDQKQREAMYASSLNLVRHIGYTNAGTIEFLVDEKSNFYFIEMNTRLQVEHPITEMVTNLDIVEWQIRIAAGEHLTVSKKDIRSHGHSIEARIYPEDPVTSLPTAGTVVKIKEPKGKVSIPTLRTILLRISTFVVSTRIVNRRELYDYIRAEYRQIAIIVGSPPIGRVGILSV